MVFTEREFTDVQKAAEAVIPGASTLRITFEKDSGLKRPLTEAAKIAIGYFFLMRDSMIFMTEGQTILCTALQVAGYYHNEENRTFLVRTRLSFDKPLFAHQLRYGVEKIVVIDAFQ